MPPQSVQDLLALYGWLADRHDLAALLELFAQDARLESPKTKTTLQGREAIGGLLKAAWSRQPANEPARRHLITGVRVVGAEGDESRFEATFGVLGTSSDGQAKVYATGYYEGVARSAPEGMLFVLLRIVLD